MDFRQPHLVPQTTKSLLNTDQNARQRQSKAYSRDVSNNKRKMDDVRHAQYSKQNTAVNKQKSHMQDNAAKASKAVTGSSRYYKEDITFEMFLEKTDFRKEVRRIDDRRKLAAKEALRKKQENRGRYSQAGGPTEKAGQLDSSRIRGGTREAGPNSGNRVPAHRSIVKYTGKKEEPKKEEPKKEPKAKKEPKPKAEREPKPKTEKAPRQETGYGGGKTMSRGEERAARLKDTQALDKQKLENAKNKEKRFAQREKDRKKASRSAALGGLLNRIRSKDSADNQVTPGSVYKGSTMTYGGSK